MSNLNVITIGRGFVANHLPYKIAEDRFYPRYSSIGEFLDYYNPDVVVNCIGFTGGAGRNIDGCEERKKKTFDTNTVLPIMIAQACESRGIRVIQIGSGCIYYGPSPRDNSCEGNVYVNDKFVGREMSWDEPGWEEDDAADPESTYSKSKYACDLVLGTMENVTTLRIRMPISWKNEPRNLISKLIGYKRVVERPNSVTFMNDLSRSVDWAIYSGAVGTYHVTSPKPITHSQILNEYKKYVPEHEFESISEEELNKLVSAPRSNCILDSSKIISQGFKFEDQDQALEEYVRKFAESSKGQ